MKKWHGGLVLIKKANILALVAIIGVVFKPVSTFAGSLVCKAALPVNLIPVLAFDINIVPRTRPYRITLGMREPRNFLKHKSPTYGDLLANADAYLDDGETWSPLKITNKNFVDNTLAITTEKMSFTVANTQPPSLKSLTFLGHNVDSTEVNLKSFPVFGELSKNTKGKFSFETISGTDTVQVEKVLSNWEQDLKQLEIEIVDESDLNHVKASREIYEEFQNILKNPPNDPHQNFHFLRRSDGKVESLAHTKNDSESGCLFVSLVLTSPKNLPIKSILSSTSTKGSGTAILKNALFNSHSQGATKACIILEALPNARPFYDKLGFRELGRVNKWGEQLLILDETKATHFINQIPKNSTVDYVIETGDKDGLEFIFARPDIESKKEYFEDSIFDTQLFANRRTGLIHEKMNRIERLANGNIEFESNNFMLTIVPGESPHLKSMVKLNEGQVFNDINLPISSMDGKPVNPILKDHKDYRYDVSIADYEVISEKYYRTALGKKYARQAGEMIDDEFGGNESSENLYRSLRGEIDEHIDPYQKIPENPGKYWVIIDRETDNVAGIGGLYTYVGKESEAQWMGWFAVDPQHQGNGLGGRMLRFLIEKARASGTPALRLWTEDLEAERTAQIVYLKHGLRLYKKTAVPGEEYHALFRELRF